MVRAFLLVADLIDANRVLLHWCGSESAVDELVSVVVDELVRISVAGPHIMGPRAEYRQGCAVYCFVLAPSRRS